MSEQNFLSSIPYHAAFGFLIPLHLGLLGIYVQSTNKSPFETHPAAIYIFILATLIYGFTFAADLRYKFHQTTYSQLFGSVALITGFLASISMDSIFVPWWLGVIFYILWFFMIIVVAYQQATSIKEIFSLLYQKIKDQKIKDTYDWLQRTINEKKSNYMEQHLSA